MYSDRPTKGSPEKERTVSVIISDTVMTSLKDDENSLLLTTVFLRASLDDQKT